jgi:uncharacterized membrane protein
MHRSWVILQFQGVAVLILPVVVGVVVLLACSSLSTVRLGSGGVMGVS